MRRPLALAALAVAVFGAPAVAGPPKIECTQPGGYYPPIEEAWAALPAAARQAVIEACDWDS